MEFLTSQNGIITLSGITALLLILFIVNIILTIKLRSSFKKLTRGKKINQFEDVIESINKDLTENKKFHSDLENYLSKVEKRLSKSIQGIGQMNFNAFKGAETGGKSFAVTMLNEKGDGVIFSSLHARDRVSVFSKKVSNFKPELALSEEEEITLTKAKESCNL